ncbi:hypothetical protein CAPTEDRAFT_64398, partial [Capitella teleta]
AKREFIKQRLKQDVLSVDLQWSIFVSALQSYRHNSVLRPFPPQFELENSENGEEKDYDSLRKTVDELPYIGVLIEAEDCKEKASSEIVDLVYWLLKKPFHLQFCEKDMFSEIKRLIGQSASSTTASPHFIFEIIHHKSSSEKFNDLRGGRDLIYACHGSRLENFHSILHYGLQGHLNKNALFGEGTYLSAELSVCFPFAPTGTSWNRSLLGEKLSCIAVCEIIDDDSVYCHLKSQSFLLILKSKIITGSPGGEVPEKYYVVRNNEVMRVKYLLIYAEKKPKKPSFKRSVVHWLFHHKFAVIMILYALILIFVSLYNSRGFHSYVKKFFK